MSVKLKSFMIQGATIRFRYPEANYRGVRLRLKVRRLHIEKIIDVEQLRVHSPRPDIEAADPLLQRSRYLICGTDMDTGEYRQFYDGSMQEVELVQVKPSSIVMAEGYDTGFTVGVVECQLSNPPSADDLPSTIKVIGLLARGVGHSLALTIASAANRDALSAGSKNRWAVVFPPSPASENSVKRSISA